MECDPVLRMDSHRTNLRLKTSIEGRFRVVNTVDRLGCRKLSAVSDRAGGTSGWEMTSRRGFPYLVERVAGDFPPSRSVRIAVRFLTKNWIVTTGCSNSPEYQIEFQTVHRLSTSFS